MFYVVHPILDPTLGVAMGVKGVYIVKLKVSKKPEKRNEELLTSDKKNSNEGSLWNSITSTLAGISMYLSNLNFRSIVRLILIPIKL